MNFLKFLLYFVIAVEASVHVCQHDQSKVPTVIAPITKAKSTKATSDSFEPIRFGKYVFNMPSVSAANMVILNRLFDETIGWMSSYLKVIPLTSPIKLQIEAKYMDYYEAPTEHRTNCGSIANAQFLQADANSQPYIGLVRVCKDSIDVSNELYYKTVLLHEITHALGFSNQVFQRMKDSSGNSYLKTQQTSDGINRNILATPKVTSFIKDHFECDTLQGAFLENEGGSGTAGSHWESTVYNYELMTGWISSTKINILTNMTLNWLEDTGWYKVDYSAANNWIFGYKKGCEMAELQCSKTVDNVIIPSGDYCIVKQPAERECTADFEAVGVCTKSSGNDCPIVSPYLNTVCKDARNNNPNNDIPFGILYSSTSYCHYNDLLITRYTGEDIKASCLKTKCNNDGSYSLVICNKENGCNSENEYVEKKCSRKGEKVTINGFNGQVTCNDPEWICGKSSGGGDSSDTGSGSNGSNVPDIDEDYTGTDDNGGGGSGGGEITRKPSVNPTPITEKPDLGNDKGSNYVVCVMMLVFIIVLML